MKKTLFAAVAVAMSLLVAPVAQAEPVILSPGIVMFHSSGIFNGRTYSTVTMNRNIHTMTMNYDDGGQYTAPLDESMFWVMMDFLVSQDRSPTTVNMD
jgi:hypothetical protein